MDPETMTNASFTLERTDMADDDEKGHHKDDDGKDHHKSDDDGKGPHKSDDDGKGNHKKDKDHDKTKKLTVSYIG
jgi:hypothetical protein